MRTPAILVLSVIFAATACESPTHQQDLTEEGVTGAMPGMSSLVASVATSLGSANAVSPVPPIGVPPGGQRLAFARSDVQQFNYIPFGRNNRFTWFDFCYETIESFDIGPGDFVVFDVNPPNDVDIVVTIELAPTTVNNSNRFSEGHQFRCQPDATFVQVVNAGTPAVPKGDNNTGDPLELTYTVDQPFSFSGGGLIIRIFTNFHFPFGGPDAGPQFNNVGSRGRLGNKFVRRDGFGAGFSGSHVAIPQFEIWSGLLSVDIDIKPGSDPNSLNCNNENVSIAVAILTTDDFDATTVDHTTVTFEGASETHVDKKSGLPRRHEEDVDGDGDTDLVFHFRLGETGLGCESAQGTLQGQTFGGQAIEGTDAVRMIDEGGDQA